MSQYGGQKFDINNIPLTNFTIDFIINGVYGDYTLNFEGFDYFKTNGYDVFLNGNTVPLPTTITLNSIADDEIATFTITAVKKNVTAVVNSTVEVDLNGKYNINIFTINGRNVYSGKGLDKSSFHISEIGVYIVNIIDENGVGYTKKVVID